MELWEQIAAICLAAMETMEDPEQIIERFLLEGISKEDIYYNIWPDMDMINEVQEVIDNGGTYF